MEGMASFAVGAALFLLTVLWVNQWLKRRNHGSGAKRLAPSAAVGIAGSQSPVAVAIDPAASWAQVRGDAQWFAPGQAVTVASITIQGGLFYLGRSLPTQAGHGVENCLINPRLPVARTPNKSGQGMPYWPNYSAIDPGSRRAYLEWLASTRDDPQTYIGYVFLYFYGLERRLFLEDVQADTSVIVAEVRRLFAIYGTNRSFHTYASAFLDAAAALTNRWPPKPTIDPEHKLPEISLRLRGAIGALIQRGGGITADWALAWYAASPDYRFHTPALRCFREFAFLFRQRFEAKWPQGLSFRAPRRNLSVRYRAASGTFTATVRGDFESLPDIVSLTAPLAEIDHIVADCTEALEPYSRLIGRDASARSSLAASLALPKELLQNAQEGGPIAAVRKRLAALLPKTSGMVPLGELLQMLQIDAGSKVSKSETVAVAAALENLGFAMEPDPRHGGSVPLRESEVMVFHQHGRSFDAAPSAGFLNARAHVEISILVAMASGQIDADEARAVITQIKAIPGLSEFQRARLIGYLGYLVRNPPNLRAVNRFKNRSIAERKALADVAVTTATVTGRLDPAEIRVLEKTYKALGFEKSDLYHELHALGAHQDDHDREPPLVARGTPSRGVPIPPPEPPRSSGIKLDQKRIARIQAETRTVKSILDGVFNDDDTADDEPPPAPTPALIVSNTSFMGLDDRYAALLTDIISLDAIDQATFSELARRHGLFAAGAIEAINEWSFQRYDEPLLDDGEPIEIARHLFRVLSPQAVSEHVT